MLYRLMKTLREKATDRECRRLLQSPAGDVSAWETPLIIGGTGGSGTRALSKTLQHAGFSLGENLNDDHDSLDVAEFLHHWVPQWISHGSAALPQGRQERMDRHFLAALAKLRGHSVGPRDPWLIKNPRLMYLLPFLNRLLPGFRFLHLVRDGRDMAFSKNQGQLAYLGQIYLQEPVQEKNPIQSARLWARANLAAHTCGRELLRERYLLLRFEDLCANPEDVAERVFTFADASGDASRAAAEINPPASLGRWKQQDEALVSQVEEICRPALETFGYHVGSG